MHIKKLLLIIMMTFWVNNYAHSMDANFESIDAKDMQSVISAGDAKVKVVFVFTTWCKYCKIGYLKLKEIASLYSAADLKVIPMSLDEKQSQFENFVQEYNKEKIIPKVYRIKFSSSRDLVKELANAKIEYQGSIPHVTVFNKEGKVLIDGRFEGDYLAALVESLIKK